MTETAKEFINKKEKQYLKGKTIKIKDIGRKGFSYWNTVAWVFMPQTKHPEKVFVIERLEFSRTERQITKFGKDEEIEAQYRIGYYIVGRIGNKNKKWTWGQYCPFIPQKYLDKLLKLAKKKKVIL